MKVFTDTSRFDDSWFMALSPEAKLLLYYIECKVNCAGVWEANFRLAEQQIGRKLDWAALIAEINNPKERLIWISESKLWHWTVIPFRYGNELHEGSARAKFQGALWRTLREMGLLSRLKTISPTLRIIEDTPANTRLERPSPAPRPPRLKPVNKTPQEKIADIDAAILRWSTHKGADGKLTMEAEAATDALQKARKEIEAQILESEK